MPTPIPPRPTVAPAPLPSFPADQVVTIERTAKRWKRLWLIGTALMLFGVLGYAALTEPWRYGPGVVALIGLGVWLVAKAGAWWGHA